MLFNHVVEILPAIIGQSTYGGINQYHAANGTTYAAFVQTRNESRDIINQTGGVRTGIVAYISGICPAKPLDRLIYDGKTYEITGAMPARTPTATHHTKLICLELDNV